MAESIEHRIIRSKTQSTALNRTTLIEEMGERPSESDCTNLAAEHHYIPRPPRHLKCQLTYLPHFITAPATKVQCTRRNY